MVPTEGGNGHRQPLLHVGYAKTGSTWLQKSVFGRPDGPFLLLPLLDALEYFVFRDDAETAPGRIAAELAGFRTRADAADAVPVVSHEVLVGDQTQGRYWGHQVARRLQAVFPDGRVLMVIREQTAMLVSSYRQHLHVGGTETLAAFFSRQPGFEATCRPDFLAYDRMIAFYQELMADIRAAIETGRFAEVKAARLAGMDKGSGKSR